MSGMHYTVVQSSDIKIVGYDRSRELLHIKFHNGTEYAYANVPYSVVRELLEAKSVGRYFHQNIKEKFHYERVYT